MECDVCMEQFNVVERRPKVLPCGHSYCLLCLKQLPTKACPVDKRVFTVPPEQLVDNYKLLNTHSRPAGFWCVTCEKEATEDCVEDHAVRSLKKQRAREAEPHLEALQRGKAALAKLRKVLDLAETASSVQTKNCRGRVEQMQAGLAAARTRLQGAQDSHTAVWEQAKGAAVLDGLCRSTAQLVADLADPAATCSLTLRRGAEGGVAWRGEVRPAEDAVLRMLLCLQACSGGLQPHQEQQLEEKDQPDSQWQECSNIQEMSVQEMAARMVVGSRVARGRDWEFGNQDGCGPGTVVEVVEIYVEVEWDHDGSSRPYYMGENAVGERYDLRLLAPEIDKVFGIFGTDVKCTDVRSMAVDADVGRRWRFSADTDFEQVRALTGLCCGNDPGWCLSVLQQVEPHLEVLEIVSPDQQHLDIVNRMPKLHTLSITNEAGMKTIHIAIQLSKLHTLSLTNVTGEQLQVVSQMTSLRRLELHCRLDAPLPLLTFPATAARLRWLRCGVHPLATALALVRAHADSLEELQLVAASTEPYGCPDLALQLQRCHPKKLKRMVLLRGDAYGEFCRHDEGSCMKQRVKIVYRFSETGLLVDVICNVCQSGQ